ncbi:cyanophycin synthetase [Flavobacterium ardleyense]|uniref:cyanophycin synthetase n=1 Tax=Flavobacterium ardleyense TaxID=2038737 RepID=UPI00298C5510|nr:cyanophycin synthetase [Flavobacterium ardleyense]
MKIVATRYLKGSNIWSSYYKPLVQFTVLFDNSNVSIVSKLTDLYGQLESLNHAPIVFQNDQIHAHNNQEEKVVILLCKIGLLLQPFNNQLNYYFNFRSAAAANTYLFAFGYQDFDTARYVVNSLKSIVSSLGDGKDVEILEIFQQISKIYYSNQLGPSTASIVAAAEARSIPWRRFGKYSKIYLGYGVKQKQFQATIAGSTSCLAVDDAGNKQKTKNLLSQMFIPVPEGSTCDSEDELSEIIDTLGYPLVIKPLNGNQGKGATINITTWTAAHAAYLFAQTISTTVLVERYTKGFDFRILLIDYKVVAAAKRNPAHVIGDGIHSIKKLIEIENHNPERGIGHTKNLTKITIDQDSHNMLLKQNISLESVADRGQVVFLKSTANLSTGGTAEDVTDHIHPENNLLAERAAKIMGLNICGLDIIAETLEMPIRKNNGVIIEVNAAPGFRMHLAPSSGIPRSVGEAVVDMLYPPKSNFRIPIIAVTGTNGKTTITRLTAFIAKTAGFTPGFTTTDGIYVNDILIAEGDMTGPQSAKIVLSDPTVDYAVLETARGGILRAGLYYDYCDVGIISNIQGDHLGLHNIDTLEDLANVKAVVAHSVKPSGWAVLNGTDENCVKIASTLKCNYAFFIDKYNYELIESLSNQNIAVAFYQEGNLTILKDKISTIIAHCNHIPLTVNGTCRFMMANVLAAALATFLQGISAKHIATALSKFIPDSKNTPGRMNHFQHNGYEIIVDYAHNVHGYKAMQEYLKNFEGKRIIGIISAVGDRRDQDIIECGLLAGQMFDHIIIRQEADLRGREADNIVELLKIGIASANENITVEVIENENFAVVKALDIAHENDLVVALSEMYESVIDVILQHQIKI